MIEFRQVIFPGDVGSDVLAVKHALQRMGVQGSGALNDSERAGPAFVKALKVLQRHHDLTSDGKYGKKTHAVVAPHFDAADVKLYEKAAVRKHETPELANGDAAAAAKRLLELAKEGKYHADNPSDMADIEATAAGRAVHSQHGGLVHIDARVLEVLLHLIDDLGHKIGTFAICSDHHDDGPNGHAGGKAVDISTIDGHAVASPSSRASVVTIDKALCNAGKLKPRQLITAGCGNARDPEILHFCLPSFSIFDAGTLNAHCNHIHIGY